MQHFAWTNLLNCRQQFLLNRPVITKLILGNPHHNHAYPELCEVLLELQFSVNSH